MNIFSVTYFDSKSSTFILQCVQSVVTDICGEDVGDLYGDLLRVTTTFGVECSKLRHFSGECFVQITVT